MPQDIALDYRFVDRSGKNVFGIMQVSKPPYQDPTTNATNWLAIDFKPIKTFKSPISLWQIKAEPILQNIGLIKQPRLSVMRLSKNEFEKIINLKIENPNPNKSECVARVVYRSTELTTKSPALGRPQGFGATFLLKLSKYISEDTRVNAKRKLSLRGR